MYPSFMIVIMKLDCKFIENSHKGTNTYNSHFNTIQANYIKCNIYKGNQYNNMYYIFIQKSHQSNNKGPKLMLSYSFIH